METTLIEKKFEQLGARVKINDEPPNRRRRVSLGNGRTISIDVLHDEEGEYFDILAAKEAEMLIMDVQKKDRHLLLMARDNNGSPLKFLCGHDERHWFSCAIPGGVSTVAKAKQALKPTEVIQAEIRGKVKTKDSQKRRRRMKIGGKIIRQGEFMFIPVPDMHIDENSFRSPVLKNEPLSRGNGSKPHMAEFLSRHGGTVVRVCRQYPNGITEKEYDRILKQNKEAKSWLWQTRARDATAYVKGRIRHSDHATVNLGNIWHRVAINTENRARGARNVAFLD